MWSCDSRTRPGAAARGPRPSRRPRRSVRADPRRLGQRRPRARWEEPPLTGPRGPSTARPSPFVPYDDAWTSEEDPPAFRGLYLASLERSPAGAHAAAIPVGLIQGEVLLVAGQDDQVWPSERFALEIARTREQAGRSTTVLTHAFAGHRIVLPGETPPSGGMSMQRGGTPEADAALGSAAWQELTHSLALRSTVF